MENHANVVHYMYLQINKKKSPENIFKSKKSSVNLKSLDPEKQVNELIKSACKLSNSSINKLLHLGKPAFNSTSRKHLISLINRNHYKNENIMTDNYNTISVYNNEYLKPTLSIIYDGISSLDICESTESEFYDDNQHHVKVEQKNESLINFKLNNETFEISGQDSDEPPNLPILFLPCPEHSNNIQLGEQNIFQGPVKIKVGDRISIVADMASISNSVIVHNNSSDQFFNNYLIGKKYNLSGETQQQKSFKNIQEYNLLKYLYLPWDSVQTLCSQNWKKNWPYHIKFPQEVKGKNLLLRRIGSIYKALRVILTQALTKPDSKGVLYSPHLALSMAAEKTNKILPNIYQLDLLSKLTNKTVSQTFLEIISDDKGESNHFQAHILFEKLIKFNSVDNSIQCLEYLLNQCILSTEKLSGNRLAIVKELQELYRLLFTRTMFPMKNNYIHTITIICCIFHCSKYVSMNKKVYKSLISDIEKAKPFINMIHRYNGEEGLPFINSDCKRQVIINTPAYNIKYSDLDRVYKYNVPKIYFDSKHYYREYLLESAGNVLEESSPSECLNSLRRLFIPKLTRCISPLFQALLTDSLDSLCYRISKTTDSKLIPNILPKHKNLEDVDEFTYIPLVILRILYITLNCSSKDIILKEYMKALPLFKFCYNMNNISTINTINIIREKQNIVISNIINIIGCFTRVALTTNTINKISQEYILTVKSLYSRNVQNKYKICKNSAISYKDIDTEDISHINFLPSKRTNIKKRIKSRQIRTKSLTQQQRYLSNIRSSISLPCTSTLKDKKVVKLDTLSSESSTLSYSDIENNHEIKNPNQYRGILRTRGGETHLELIENDTSMSETDYSEQSIHQKEKRPDTSFNRAMLKQCQLEDLKILEELTRYLWDDTLLTDTEVLFIWEEGGETIEVATSFDNWQSRLTLNWSGKVFMGSMKLPKGERVEYKFIVDGIWTESQHQEKVVHDCGTVNNVLYAHGTYELLSKNSENMKFQYKIDTNDVIEGDAPPAPILLLSSMARAVYWHDYSLNQDLSLLKYNTHRGIDIFTKSRKECNEEYCYIPLNSISNHIYTLHLPYTSQIIPIAVTCHVAKSYNTIIHCMVMNINQSSLPGISNFSE